MYSWEILNADTILQVESLIKRAKEEWNDLHKDDVEKTEMMLPLIRLKVGDLFFNAGSS